MITSLSHAVHTLEEVFASPLTLNTPRPGLLVDIDMNGIGVFLGLEVLARKPLQAKPVKLFKDFRHDDSCWECETF